MPKYPLEARSGRLSAADVKAAKQPQQDEDYENDSQDAAQSWQAVIPGGVVSTAATEQQEQNHDD
jgi:hypothetical protein